MDEESLEAALQTYHAQLRLVERALDAGPGAGLGPDPDAGPGAGLDPGPDAGPDAGLDPGPDSGPDAGLGSSPDAGPGAGPDAAAEADLRQLQGDLKELIALTEASLVSVRKSKLLAALEPEPAARDDAEYLAFQKAIAEAAEAPAAPGADLETVPEGEARPEPTTPGREEGEDRDPEEELSGAKVNAPYYSAWGTLEYHNAMVVGTEEAEDGTACVRVLYLYPTHKSLKPCPFFLEGKCRFKENCRFSHGQVVSVDELRPFQDPDLSLLQVGSACLAKHQDGLWHPARITDVDSGYYTVKFDSLLLKEAVVEGDSILPPLRTEGPESSDSDSGDTDDSSYARVVESTVDPGTCSSAFAGWEVHTRGIGSKLLAKMGYELGKGLGRRAEGRVEPIHAVVLPRGKSLDQCAEILQKRTKRAQASASRPPRCRGSRRGPRGRQPPRNVFDFLNEKLQSQAPGVLEAGVDPPGRKNKDMYHATKSTKQALSLQLFQTEEKIQQTRRDIGSIQEALSRNAGRHGLATAQLQERLEGAQRQLGQLRAQEAGLQLQRRKADTHRKMTEF
ncbi:zinc finger CCCH-type with G patch domain-containing protein-like [Dipodomys merriami]|uniref:zinc finger CCCH-type with G patch domain-containing protein-like n=1 Tax=Dipodomys merriami TaxID=94247 RepID=UPI003855BD05